MMLEESCKWKKSLLYSFSFCSEFLFTKIGSVIKHGYTEPSEPSVVQVAEQNRTCGSISNTNVHMI